MSNVRAGNQKVTAGGAALVGAGTPFAILVAWLLEATTGTQMPAEAAAALGSILGGIVGLVGVWVRREKYDVT